MESKNHQEKKSSNKKKKDLVERLNLDLINIQFFKDEILRLQTEITECHLEIKQAYESYIAESEAFETKGVKAAAARARKALGLLGKATKVRRKEIQEKKNSM